MSGLLDAAQAAKALGCGKRFLYEELGKGNLVGSFYADRWHIAQADIDAYIEAHKPKPGETAKKGRRRPRRNL